MPIHDIASELRSIASSLRTGGEATLQERYNVARITYLDNVVERLAEILEADRYSVSTGKRSGKRILQVEESMQMAMFGAPNEPQKMPFEIVLSWEENNISWSQDRGGRDLANGEVEALRNTPTASAKEIAGGLELD